MDIVELKIKGAKIIQRKKYLDERGFFYEWYHRPSFVEAGIDCEFVQDNHSFSKQGTIRGMHFQKGQAKLVYVALGAIDDILVDIRPDSPTFGQWEKIRLSGENPAQLFIPDGVAHGFAVLSPEVHLIYKLSAVYNPAQEKTFHYRDPKINIEWPEFEEPLLSQRDQKAPSFSEAIPC